MTFRVVRLPNGKRSVPSSDYRNCVTRARDWRLVTIIKAGRPTEKNLRFLSHSVAQSFLAVSRKLLFSKTHLGKQNTGNPWRAAREVFEQDLASATNNTLHAAAAQKREYRLCLNSLRWRSPKSISSWANARRSDTPTYARIKSKKTRR